MFNYNMKSVHRWSYFGFSVRIRVLIPKICNIPILNAPGIISVFVLKLRALKAELNIREKQSKFE